MSETTPPRYPDQGKRVCEYRELREETQATAAERAGMHVTTWCRLEKGHFPLAKYSTRGAAAKGLALDLSDFDALWEGRVAPLRLHKRVTGAARKRRARRGSARVS